MEKLLEGKVVLVTGGGRGVGRDIALLAGKSGARVMVNDMGTSITGDGADTTVAAEVAEEIRTAGGEASYSTASVTDRSAVRAMIEQCNDELGGLNHVVNNAGILRDRMFHRMSDEEWDAVIDVHLNGAFNVSHAAAETFRKQNTGSILHMTSTAGLIGNLGQANYSAAKMGILGLSRSISIDMARSNVRSNCLAPFAFSRMTNTIPEKGGAQKPDEDPYLDKIKKMGSEKIAPLVIALGSDQASDITGQVFAVRSNEIFLMSQPRPLRSVHRSEGWTPETVLEQAIPALRSSFYAADTSRDVFNWDPI
jgi:NAD(P)-dependent dehydrogenase (short-subunit alcohol dehydrogenase family)